MSSQAKCLTVVILQILFGKSITAVAREVFVTTFRRGSYNFKKQKMQSNLYGNDCLFDNLTRCSMDTGMLAVYS